MPTDSSFLEEPPDIGTEEFQERCRNFPSPGQLPSKADAVRRQRARDVWEAAEKEGKQETCQDTAVINEEASRSFANHHQSHRYETIDFETLQQDPARGFKEDSVEGDSEDKDSVIPALQRDSHKLIATNQSSSALSLDADSSTSFLSVRSSSPELLREDEKRKSALWTEITRSRASLADTTGHKDLQTSCGIGSSSIGNIDLRQDLNDKLNHLAENTSESPGDLWSHNATQSNDFIPVEGQIHDEDLSPAEVNDQLWWMERGHTEQVFDEAYVNRNFTVHPRVRTQLHPVSLQEEPQRFDLQFQQHNYSLYRIQEALSRTTLLDLGIEMKLSLHRIRDQKTVTGDLRLSLLDHQDDQAIQEILPAHLIHFSIIICGIVVPPLPQIQRIAQELAFHQELVVPQGLHNKFLLSPSDILQVFRPEGLQTATHGRHNILEPEIPGATAPAQHTGPVKIHKSTEFFTTKKKKQAGARNSSRERGDEAVPGRLQCFRNPAEAQMQTEAMWMSRNNGRRATESGRSAESDVVDVPRSRRRQSRVFGRGMGIQDLRLGQIHTSSSTNETPASATSTSTATAVSAREPTSPQSLPRSSSTASIITVIAFSPIESSQESVLPESVPAAAGSLSYDMSNVNRLTVRPQEASQVKAKAVEDARQMQAKVNEECKKSGKNPPPYGLEELIGKGSFGRVYKGKDMKSAAVVAVKIIDIDESDTINPRNADSYSEFLKEVNALKILGENKAKNINLVIEALPVNQAMWMITEYCGGGSVATLMKPTAPGGLNEKWIIPILREVSEAIKWVHQAGIIHRDIKCANVLVTEHGDVQLCDFGVAGIVESKIDKRSTIIGTPHWMAPELFGSSPNYGNEVDIWAFGSMVYEIATGLPPNVANGIPYDRLGTFLKHHTPRLEGGDYSDNLRDLVAYCLEEDPKARPPIDKVQKHPYILNTNSAFPTSTLKALVGSFKVWESRGGSRKSLFFQHGAPGSAPSLSSHDDEWNFNSTEYFEDNVWGQYGVRDVIEAYGPAVVGFVDETTRPPVKVSRRRPPPEALSRLPAAPLEKIFDPNTLSSYEDNSRAHYGRPMMNPGSTDRSDLPLRDDSAQISIRDTMIDLGGHDPETGLSSFPELETIKAGRPNQDQEEDESASNPTDLNRTPLSDPAEINTNRRTQDWKFPSMAPPASADPGLSRFSTSYDAARPLVTPAGSGGRPALIHHPTEPVGTFGGALGSTNSQAERLSMRESLIDLDMSLPDLVSDFGRPSTANSDVGSATSEHKASGNPFELERHASMYQPVHVERAREPSIYVSDESSIPPRLQNGLQELADVSDFSASDAESTSARRREQNASHDDSDDSYYVVNAGTSNGLREDRRRFPQHDGPDDSDYLVMPPSLVPSAQSIPLPRSDSFTAERLPELPSHPSLASLTGSASPTAMATEIIRIVSAMSAQLEAFKEVYEPAIQRQGSNQRRDRDTGGI
ncbi:unnamed protein product [Diplocarpon coronariae]